MYTAELREKISQGDIFDNFPVVDIKFVASDAEPEVCMRRSRVMLISNDCDYDNCRYVMVAETRPLTDIAAKDRDNVRHGRSRKTFYLSGNPSHFPESFTDFRCVHRIAKQFIADGGQFHPRISSLVDMERLALQRSIAIFFGVSPNGPL